MTASGEKGARAPKKTDVVGVSLTAITLKRLDLLVAKGSHGGTRPEVIRNFTEAGIRQAMLERFIPIDD